jgi:hypothetical protein
MTAQPVPATIPDHGAELTEALTVLRTFGVEQLHRFGGKRSAKALERVLQYVAALEQAARREHTLRVDFEAQAEGEFHELRQEVRAWREYAGQVEARRDVLKDRLAIVCAWVAEPVRHWWQLLGRRRRSDDYHLRLEAMYGRRLCADAEPTPPAVDLDA